MNQFRTKQHQKSSIVPPASPPYTLKDKTLSSGRAHNLWLHAKTNFYYRDDVAKAAALCKRLIEQYGQTEEADDAKLLLHDIRIEIKKLTESDDRLEESDRKYREEPLTEPLFLDSRMKIPLAMATVVLPIVGIAQGGIIGIVVPESLMVVTMGVLFWVGSMIRFFIKGQAKQRLIKIQH